MMVGDSGVSCQEGETQGADVRGGFGGEGVEAIGAGETGSAALDDTRAGCEEAVEVTGGASDGSVALPG